MTPVHRPLVGVSASAQIDIWAEAHRVGIVWLVDFRTEGGAQIVYKGASRAAAIRAASALSIETGIGFTVPAEAWLPSAKVVRLTPRSPDDGDGGHAA